MPADGAVCGQAVAENAKPVAEDLMQNQVKPTMVDAAATAEETSQVLACPLLLSQACALIYKHLKRHFTSLQ